MSGLPIRLLFHGMIFQKHGMILENHGMIFEKYGMIFEKYGILLQNHGTLLEKHGIIILIDPRPRQLRPAVRFNDSPTPTSRNALRTIRAACAF